MRERSVSSTKLARILRQLSRARTYHFRHRSRANSISCAGLPQQYQLTVEDAPEAAELEALPNALEDFNESQWPGHAHWRPLGIFIRDAETIVAGLSGETYCGWLVIKYLWVRHDLRRRGVGREFMAQAEAHAAVTRLGLTRSAFRRVASMRSWVMGNLVRSITRPCISGIL